MAAPSLIQEIATYIDQKMGEANECGVEWREFSTRFHLPLDHWPDFKKRCDQPDFPFLAKMDCEISDVEPPEPDFIQFSRKVPR